MLYLQQQHNMYGYVDHNAVYIKNLTSWTSSMESELFWQPEEKKRDGTLGCQFMFTNRATESAISDQIFPLEWRWSFSLLDCHIDGAYHTLWMQSENHCSVLCAPLKSTPLKVAGKEATKRVYSNFMSP